MARDQSFAQEHLRRGGRPRAETLATFVTLASIQLALRRLARA